VSKLEGMARFVGVCTSDMAVVASVWVGHLGLDAVKSVLEEIYLTDTFEGVAGHGAGFDERHLIQVFRELMTQICLVWSLHLGESNVRCELRSLIDDYDWSLVESVTRKKVSETDSSKGSDN
jgi:hypothetical protein